MASISARGRYITATLGVEPALWHDPTQEALRRYRRRAWATLAIGLAAVILLLPGTYVFEAVEGGNPDAPPGLLIAAVVGGMFGVLIVSAPALIGGAVSLLRVRRMTEWLARAAWHDVAVRVGHSGGTAVVLLPDEGSFSAVPTEPYLLQTWRWRLKKLQGVERIWVARTGGSAVVMHVPGSPELYVARRSSISLLRRWHALVFATGLPPAGGGG